MNGWKGIAGIALVACASCTPARHPSSARVQIVPVAADQRLLSGLALDVSDEPGAPILPARPIAAGAPPFVAATDNNDGQRAADCLSAAVYYEARSEPLDGQRAVAQVVLNRVRDRAFPASVCGVVYQRSARGCQFSFVCDGSMGHAIEPRAWLIAQTIARAALSGSVFAPVGTATHYHTTAILPWWAPSLARIGAIGSHIFYRWADRLAGTLSFRQSYSGRETLRVAAAAAAATPLADAVDGALANEAGVTVHRGPGPAQSMAARSMANMSFGVRVHRGVPGSVAGTVIGGSDGDEAPPAP